MLSFLQRGNVAEAAKAVTLVAARPSISLEGLQRGVDNIRHDVYLSPAFTEVTRLHISKLIAKYGDVEDFLVADAFANANSSGYSSRPAQTEKKSAKKADPAEFKRMLGELLSGALNFAKQQENASIDYLARLAVIKFFRTELSSQYADVLDRCKVKLKAFDGPRQANPAKALVMRERFAQFQINKRAVLRKAGQELFSTLRELEKETIARLRRSLFSDENTGVYELFTNRLIFTEDGKDDLLNAEQYVMLGNFGRDPDRYQVMLEIAYEFLKTLEFAPVDDGFDAYMCVPENAQELLAGGSPDENTPKGKAQKILLAAWLEALEQEGVFHHVIASYEAVPLLAQYAATINPQQLKIALINKEERKRVERLLGEHGKLSADAIHGAVKRVEGYKSQDKLRLAGRFLGDLMRYTRDLRRMEVVIAASDQLNVIGNDRLRELSSINNTLYELLLPEEQKTTEGKICDHVILKADVRDSTMLTRTLSERGLNPASYFSLNFYDPINKLLPKYEATKVFIEGDAVILALFEREGEPNYPVARMCVLAKEMIDIVRAYNEKSAQAGLPSLELGLGISYQDSSPMYLMDGSHRIMISKALNESDRLSSCSKGARKFLQQPSVFNVFAFQTVEDKDTVGDPNEFLVRYNIGGILMSQEAFTKLSTEISLKPYDVRLKNPWVQDVARLYYGTVPVAPGIFHNLVVREAVIPHVHADDLSIERWTDRKYYEVCTNQRLYQYFEQHAASAGAR